ncbi:NlpC/P60 family protein [Geomonas paludis]|uniref:NlpC/P60 family protein n=1 Tax=Geomonas paludis TaxID=2740185 RepID=A0A6V8N2J8_9BACT|nr:C40 family peptidase [Geomonas paludis]UPU36918.1 NlpC/P60 family protein [Geomonas paludis]GFO65589.1 peptidoglycan-binding protein LysM [Geomonas paludis]
MIKSLKLFTLCIVMLSVPSLAFAAKTHRVKKHETLYSLAKKYNVTVEELKAANNLVGNSVKPRVLLVIPPRSVSEGKSASAGSDTKVYKVKKSETLSRIAKKTGVSVAELKRLNGLSGSRVKAGKVLVLKESEPADEPKVKVSRKLQLRHPDLFNEKDYEQSIQELASLEPEHHVDLSKSTELKADSIKELKKSAYGFLGTRYRFGGSSRSGIDCSSFVQHVFKELEVSLPRTAREQFEVGSAVAPGDLQRGDLIFFATYASYPSHVGIYLGNNKMIHASSRDRRVVISSLNTSYYRSRFLGAKRIAKVNPDVFKLDDLILGVEEDNSENSMEEDGLTSN